MVLTLVGVCPAGSLDVVVPVLGAIGMLIDSSAHRCVLGMILLFCVMSLPTVLKKNRSLPSASCNLFGLVKHKSCIF
jgi:hypothetical protein